MRKVQIYKYEQNKDKPSTHDKVEDEIGIFIQFGVNFEGFGEGPGNYTTAIIEMSDGTIRNVDVEMVRFLDKPAKESTP